MKVEIAVLADAANVSRESKLNICGIFQNIFGQAAPISWPMMTLVLQLRLDASETGRRHALGLKLHGPDGKVVQQFPDAQFESTAELTAPKVTLPLTINFSGLAFPTFGTYSFEVQVNGEVLTNVELEVGRIPTQRAAQAA